LDRLAPREKRPAAPLGALSVLHGARGGGGGGVCGGGGAYRQSAYAPSPGYLGVTAALSASEALTSGRPRRSPAAWAAGAGGRRQRACGPLPGGEPPAPCVPRAAGHTADCALVFSALHPLCVRRLQVAKRACVLSAEVHVGQARGFVFVEVAPCPYVQPLAYAVPPLPGMLGAARSGPSFAPPWFLRRCLPCLVCCGAARSGPRFAPPWFLRRCSGVPFFPLGSQNRRHVRSSRHVLIADRTKNKEQRGRPALVVNNYVA
jgi:hypothetical protein